MKDVTASAQTATTDMPPAIRTADERDLFFMGMLKPLGIEKGKAFKPDARQRKILEEAAQMGDAMGRVMLFDGPDRFRQVGEGLGLTWNTQCHFVPGNGSTPSAYPRTRRPSSSGR
jgi:hypothetical protein